MVVTDQLLRIGLAAAIAPFWMLVLMALIVERIPKTAPAMVQGTMRASVVVGLLLASVLHILAIGIALWAAFQ